MLQPHPAKQVQKGADVVFYDHDVTTADDYRANSRVVLRYGFKSLASMGVSPNGSDKRLEEDTIILSTRGLGDNKMRSVMVPVKDIRSVTFRKEAFKLFRPRVAFAKFTFSGSHDAIVMDGGHSIDSHVPLREIEIPLLASEETRLIQALGRL